MPLKIGVQRRLSVHDKVKSGSGRCKWQCAGCRADYNCNAWTWCDDTNSCTDELLTQIPYRGCQLKWDPHEPWGVPADELTKNFQPSMFTSGYIKSEMLDSNCPTRQAESTY